MSKASEMFCAIAKENDDKKNAGLTTPEEIKRFDDIQYGPDPKWNVLDVYRRKDQVGKLPVIISIHGGGYVYGDKELYQFYCMDLALRGYAVINFTYTLAPHKIFPSPLEETNMVVEWMFNNAEEYEFDLEHVYLVGDSAGAHINSLYSAICTNPEYAKTFDFKVPNNFKPNAIALNCGSYDQTKEAGGEGPMADMLKQLAIDSYGKVLNEEEKKHNSVVYNMNENYPPTYIMSSTGDFLLDQVKYGVPVFEKYGIKFVKKIYGDDKNLLPHVFHCDLTCPDGKVCNDDEIEFFKQF